MVTIYLAGGIKNLTTKQASSWREKAIKELGMNAYILNPLERNYELIRAQSDSEIVRFDKNEILQSDVVLANVCRPSWGTAMEIIYAIEHNKTVIGFVDENTVYKELSPWVRFHCAYIGRGLTDAIKKLRHVFL